MYFSETINRMMPNEEERMRRQKQVFYRLFNNAPEDNARISTVLDSTSMHDIMLSSDMHFLRNGEEEDILHVRGHNDVIDSSKVWVCLGDIGFKMDTSEQHLAYWLDQLNKARFSVLCKGNHDLFRHSFYRRYFDVVTNGFVWRELAFSHIPLKIDRNIGININIHGHLHEMEYRDYFDCYSANKYASGDSRVNQLYIKVFTDKSVNYRPQSLFSVLSHYISDVAKNG